MATDRPEEALNIVLGNIPSQDTIASITLKVVDDAMLIRFGKARDNGATARTKRGSKRGRKRSR